MMIQIFTRTHGRNELVKQYICDHCRKELGETEVIYQITLLSHNEQSMLTFEAHGHCVVEFLQTRVVTRQ